MITEDLNEIANRFFRDKYFRLTKILKRSCNDIQESQKIHGILDKDDQINKLNKDITFN